MRPHLLKHGAIPWVGVAFGAIHVPIQRLQVVPGIRSTLRGRLDVVNLPAVFRIGVAVLGILHHFAASIVPPNLLVVSLNRFACRPDLQLGCFIGAFERVLVCHGVGSGESFLPNDTAHTQKERVRIEALFRTVGKWKL